MRARRRLGSLTGRRGAIALGALLVVLISVFDVAVGREVTLIPLLVAGPLVAASSIDALGTGAVALLAVVASVPLGKAGMAFMTTQHAIEVAGVALVGLLSTVTADRQGRLAAARGRTAFMAGAGGLLETLRDPDAMLREIVQLAIPALADLCIVDLREPDGSISGSAAAAADPAAARALHALRERFPLDPESDHPVAVALRTGKPQLLAELTREELSRYASSREHLELMLRLRYSSAIVVPLRARDQTLGVISFLQLADGHTYTPADLESAREIARRAGLALDNARLIGDLRTTERQLETILENLGEAVTVQGPDFRLVYVNSSGADLLGYVSREEALAAGIGRLSTQFLLLDTEGHPIDDEEYPGPRAARGEEPEPMLGRAVPRGGGHERWLRIKATTVRDEDGSLQLIINVLQDVTDTQRVAHQQRVLSAAGGLIGSSLDLEVTLERFTNAVVPAIGDWCRIDLADERGVLGHVALGAASPAQQERLDEMRRSYQPDPAHEPGNHEVLTTGRPRLFAEIDLAGEAAYARDERHLGLIRAIGTRSAAIVPIAAGERVLGTITVGTAESGRELGEEELDLLVELGRRAGVAVENARVHRVRSHIAMTLQRSLLPPRLPVVPGLDIAARFRAAGESTDVGGDFYDLFPVRSEAWSVVIGDVTGKGPEAAAITSLARYTLRTAAVYEQGPSAMLLRLDETLRGEDGRRRLATALCLWLQEDEDGFAVRIASGGHPLPYRVTAGAAAEPVGRPGALLGAFAGARWPEATSVLVPGDALVLYTDGVPDARGAGGERFGEQRLEAVLGGLGGAEADEIAGRIDEELLAFQEGPQRDDVAVLVLRAAA